jgi:hypothetical protein
MRGKSKVTHAKADRVILAVAALIECADFGDYTDSTTLRDLDRAADQARRIRNAVDEARR